ncbi:hemerythrin domain-containing protein [Colwellia sp. MEBiC06753]
MSLINQFFSTDHKRLDYLFAAFKSWLLLDKAQSSKFFTVFKNDLIKHIDQEENILFPLIEKLAPMSKGPTNVMCSEHMVIKRLLNDIEHRLNDTTPQDLPEILELETLLSSHNMKEENILYPMIDQNINQQQLAEIFLHMKTQPKLAG